MIETTFTDAGYINVVSELVNSPLQLSSAKECVQFEKESFGALHQMMNGLSDLEKASVWAEIEQGLQTFEDDNGFTDPCERVVAVVEKK